MSEIFAPSFEILDDLPTGPLAIEASAGTGKTYALAALATRFLAEREMAPSELLIVTFTRAAAAQLRERVRARLAGAARHLADPSALGTVEADGLLAHLGGEGRSTHLRRVVRALTELDAATITTLHGFAQQVLGALGANSGVDQDAILVGDSADLISQACTDVLAAAAIETGRPGSLPRLATLKEHTETALAQPDLVLVPRPEDPQADPSDTRLVALVEESCRRVRERRRLGSIRTFDDILTDLRGALSGPGRPGALQMLRGRYRVVMIDEFQDTDPVQWDIIRSAFADPADPMPLVLVGDPKQAIYSFRGANVHTYLAAVGAPGTSRRPLRVNWRADSAMVDALDTLLDAVSFGSDAITFAPVVAAQPDHRSHLLDAAGTPLPAISLRLALDPSLPRSTRGSRPILADEARQAIAADLVVQVAALLDGPTLPATPVGPGTGPPDGEGPPQGEGPGEPGGPAAAGAVGRRRVRPSDIAVLVRRHGDAERVQRALLAGGIPAVLVASTSVLVTPAAEQWRVVLEAAARPSDPRLARAFALTWFGGWSPERLDAASEEELSVVQAELHRWADVLMASGPVDFVRRVWADTGVAARVLARADGDRDVTDLDHLGELLAALVGPSRPGPSSLLAVFDEERAAAGELDAGTPVDLTSRRTESDASAVQIMTVWAAKGLEYPIVCVPTMWSWQSAKGLFQDPLTGRRTLDVAPKRPWPGEPGPPERAELARTEALGEDLRLLYVALTRAKHHTIVWWTRVQGSEKSGLARVLFARHGGEIDPGAFTDTSVALPADADALGTLDPLLARSEGNIVAGVHGHPAAPPAMVPHGPDLPSAPPLSISSLDRPLDRTASRWSFTAMVHDTDRRPPFGGEVGEDAGASDEAGGPDGGEDLEGGAPARPGAPGPSGSQAFPTSLDLLPAGARLGTLVHAVLEGVDFAAADLRGAVSQRVDEVLTHHPLALDLVGAGLAGQGVGAQIPARDLLVEGVVDVIETPLGPHFDNRSLRTVAAADRLDELSFELLLATGGEAPDLGEVAELVVRRTVPGELLYEWATGLAGRGGGGVADRSGPLVAPDLVGSLLGGHLTGSIDMVVRITGNDGATRFLVVDYKTNRLTPWRAAARIEDYDGPSMARAMTAHHYPLQALLYSVALHRYLRWRVHGYDPAVHLGGSAYLFLRGMAGAAARPHGDHPYGVLAWSTPPDLVAELSDLLDGRRASVGGSGRTRGEARL